MLQKALEYERAFVFAGIAGIMDWQLQEVVRHSRERSSGGVHLGRHQAISHRIADMKLRLDTIDLWLGNARDLCDTRSASDAGFGANQTLCRRSVFAIQPGRRADHGRGRIGTRLCEWPDWCATPWPAGYFPAVRKYKKT